MANQPGGQAWRATNDEAGIGSLAARRRAVGPALVVLEATGGLEVAVVGALAVAGLPVAVVNPRQVRDFAKRHRPAGQDGPPRCAVLAHFADADPPRTAPLPDAAPRALEAVVTRRRQLIEMLTAEAQSPGGAPPASGPTWRRTSTG